MSRRSGRLHGSRGEQMRGMLVVKRAEFERQNRLNQRFRGHSVAR